MACDSIIHAMDAFDDQGLIAVQLHHCARLFSGGCDKVKDGQCHLFARQKRLQALHQKGDIEGFDGFQIVRAILIFGRLRAVEVEVIKRQEARFLSKHAKMHIQAIGKRRLATARRTKHHDDARFSLHDFISNIGN